MLIRNDEDGHLVAIALKYDLFLRSFFLLPPLRRSRYIIARCSYRFNDS